MKVFIYWLKGRKPWIALFIACFAILLLTFYLYGVPVETVEYGFALCACAGIFFGALDFIRVHRRHLEIQAIERNLDELKNEILHPYGLIQSDYVKVIEALELENSRLRADYAVKREEMDDYYTLWAHQIKTPIAAMRLILQSSNGELTESEIKELETEIFRTEQYVELALGYQRLQSDVNDFIISESDLDGIVRQAVRKYSKQFIRKGLSLNYSGLNQTVLTDEKWLEFVLEQLLSNALKYTNNGCISIYIEENVTLVIEDTGIGIAEEDLPRIFEKGYTGYNGRADKKSTGIGLYVCRQVLTRIGHKIWAESKPGEGTKIFVCLKNYNLIVE